MRKTTTEFICDSCQTSYRKQTDLRRFRLQETKLGGQHVAAAVTDLCTACERSLHEKAKGFFPAEEWASLEGIVRG